MKKHTLLFPMEALKILENVAYLNIYVCLCRRPGHGGGSGVFGQVSAMKISLTALLPSAMLI